MRLVSLCLIVSLLLTLATTVRLGSNISMMEYLGGVLVLFQMGLIVLVAPTLSSSLISGEVESGGWQLLAMTRVRAWQIVVGKLTSTIWTLLLLLVATVPGYVVLLLIDSGYTDRVIGVLISLGLTGAFSVLLSAACSSLAKRTTAATTAAYLLLVLLCVGTLLPWLGEGMLFNRAFVERVMVANPVAAALSLIRMPGFEGYHLVPLNWYLLAAGCIVCAAVLWIRTWWLTRPR
jgi:ABC-type transport system involved in multi-copper enzyme maturation permease subunit